MPLCSICDDVDDEIMFPPMLLGTWVTLVVSCCTRRGLAAVEDGTVLPSSGSCCSLGAEKIPTNRRGSALVLIGVFRDFGDLMAGI